MAKLDEYLKWRGDLSFDDVSPNYIDGLLLSYLSYIEIDGIFREGITLLEVCELFFQKYSEKEILKKLSMIRMAPIYLKKMVETKRYKDLKLYFYKNDIDKDIESQFSAICIKLTDKDMFVAFRGTDDFLLSWKEDFNWSFKETVVAQAKAVRYLNEVKFDGNLYLGGHSKGGNLSIYAASNCEETIQEKIVSVMNFDGPGFYDNFLNSKGYLRIIDKVISIIPEYSIVGVILNNTSKKLFIKSSNKGITQHDPVSWEVIGGDFIYVDDISEQSKLMDRTLKLLLNNITNERKEELVNTIFGLLGEASIERIDDFAKINIRTVQNFIKSQNNLSKEKQQLIMDTFKLYLKCNMDAKNQLKLEQKEKKNQ